MILKLSLKISKENFAFSDLHPTVEDHCHFIYLCFIRKFSPSFFPFPGAIFPVSPCGRPEVYLNLNQYSNRNDCFALTLLDWRQFLCTKFGRVTGKIKNKRKTMRSPLRKSLSRFPNLGSNFKYIPKVFNSWSRSLLNSLPK